MSVLTAAKRRASPHVHRALNAAYPVVGRKRFAESFEQARAQGPVKIVIGSGGAPIDGWLNTDIVWRGRNYLDATQPWPVPEASVAMIYGDDVIEHVTLPQARQLFAHAFHALQPGGVLRLATPDVEAVARQYLDNGELAQEGLARNRELGKPFVHPVELIREVFVGAQHYLGFCYDYDSLAAEMTAVGFEVERCRSGQSRHPELVGLEVRTHPAERATALVVEGTKPAR